jgi:hypothetical protein
LNDKIEKEKKISNQNKKKLKDGIKKKKDNSFIVYINSDRVGVLPQFL